MLVVVVVIHGTATFIEEIPNFGENLYVFVSYRLFDLLI